jgi:hypothetical protein
MAIFMNGTKKGKLFEANGEIVFVPFSHPYCMKVETEEYIINELGEAYTDPKFEKFQCLACDEAKEEMNTKKFHDAYCKKTLYPHYKFNDCTCRYVSEIRNEFLDELKRMPKQDFANKDFNEGFKQGFDLVARFINGEIV